MTLEEVKKIRKDLLGFDPEDENECLEAVKQDGYAIKYIKEQTPEICQAALDQNDTAILFVKDLSMIVDE